MPTQISQRPHDCPFAFHDGEPVLELDPVVDIDEPPDNNTPKQDDFKRRGIIHHPSEHIQSLLTKAFQDGDEFDPSHLEAARKRPSMASSLSIASTAELTFDTGNTSPVRVPTPSPPHPSMTYALSRPDLIEEKTSAAAPVRQRRISFACADPPKVKPSSPKPRSTERRPTIKFACPALPSQPMPEAKPEPSSEVPQRRTSIKFACSAKPRQQSTVIPTECPPRGRDASFRVSIPTGASSDTHDKVHPTGRASKYIAATKDLRLEGSRFHEFASDEPQPDDWIVQDSSIPKRRLTMSDILEKEIAIRKLAKEALEEDETHDEYEPDMNEDDDADEDEDEDADDEDEDDEDEDDGYTTDNEHGFAESDDDDEGVEVDVPTWFPEQNPNPRLSPTIEIYRNTSSLESSPLASNKHIFPTHRMVLPRGKPDLPDSTDFVCGTFDEDRVVEDMYLIIMAARKRSKLHAIPQDIDPSFPASDPEDEEDGDNVSNTGNRDSEEHVLGFGELDDIHHGQEHLERRRRRSDTCSPRTRYRSPPPPKKQASPPCKTRGRSPHPLVGRTSPRRLQSPPPTHLPRSPWASPIIHKTVGVGCKPLTSRPGLTGTNSLPRPTGMFPGHLKQRRKSTYWGKGTHTRGAIDIVKGLEQKRQRRREKYLQKYCDRARKGQIPEKRPIPRGHGAERMRELGLYMAGKLGPGYVLSI